MKLTCPAPMCRADNDIQAETCVRCGTPLFSYARLSIHPAQLFNLGLATARQGQYTRARDLFAAVVYWCPMDREARNALAMACFALDDHVEARYHWDKVLELAPTDGLAKRGIEALEQSNADGANKQQSPPQKLSSISRGRSRKKLRAGKLQR